MRVLAEADQQVTGRFLQIRSCLHRLGAPAVLAAAVTTMMSDVARAQNTPAQDGLEFSRFAQKNPDALAPKPGGLTERIEIQSTDDHIDYVVKAYMLEEANASEVYQLILKAVSLEGGSVGRIAAGSEVEVEADGEVRYQYQGRSILVVTAPQWMIPFLDQTIEVLDDASLEASAFGTGYTYVRPKHRRPSELADLISDTAVFGHFSLDPRSFTQAAMVNQKLPGKVPDRLDLDGLRHEMVIGEELTFILKGSGKQKYPIQVTLSADEGNRLLSSDPDSPLYDDTLVKKKGKKLTVKYAATQNVVLHVIIARGGKPYSQSYSLTCKRKGKGKVAIKQTIAFANPSTPVSIQFHAPAGSALGGSVSVSPESVDVAVEQVLSPIGTDLATPKAFKTSKKGDKVTLKSSKLKLPETGTYDVQVQPNTDKSGDLHVNLSVKLFTSKAKLKDGD